MKKHNNNKENSINRNKKITENT